MPKSLILQVFNILEYSFECSDNQNVFPYLSFAKINHQFNALCASIKSKSFEFIPFTTQFKLK